MSKRKTKITRGPIMAPITNTGTEQTNAQILSRSEEEWKRMLRQYIKEHPNESFNVLGLKVKNGTRTPIFGYEIECVRAGSLPRFIVKCSDGSFAADLDKKETGLWNVLIWYTYEGYYPLAYKGTLAEDAPEDAITKIVFLDKELKEVLAYKQ